MDTQKNIDKEVAPISTGENPAAEAKTDDDFDEMEMQPMPMMADDINDLKMLDMLKDQDMPDMNMPSWHSQIMSEQLNKAEGPIEEGVPVPLIPMDEMENDIEVADPMAMRGYLEDPTDFDYTGYNYKDYNFRDYNDADDVLEKITIYNPGIFRTLASFGVPFPAARSLVKRLIKLTLNYR